MNAFKNSFEQSVIALRGVTQQSKLVFVFSRANAVGGRLGFAFVKPIQDAAGGARQTWGILTAAAFDSRRFGVFFGLSHTSVSMLPKWLCLLLPRQSSDCFISPRIRLGPSYALTSTTWCWYLCKSLSLRGVAGDMLHAGPCQLGRSCVCAASGQTRCDDHVSGGFFRVPNG